MSTSDKWRQARRRDLSASRPAKAGSSQAKPGQERRVRLKDPAVTGEGRHSLWPGESSTEAGEERQVSRKRMGGIGLTTPETATARAPGAEERSIDLVSTGDPNQQWLDTGDLRWSLAFGSMEDD